MPSLFRFLFICALLAGIVYGGMIALVFFVEPSPREITVRVPIDGPAHRPPAPAPAQTGN